MQGSDRDRHRHRGDERMSNEGRHAKMRDLCLNKRSEHWLRVVRRPFIIIRRQAGCYTSHPYPAPPSLPCPPTPTFAN